MTTTQLRKVLLQAMNGGYLNRLSVNKEILRHLLPCNRSRNLPGTTTIAYQVKDTVVFLSNGGLKKPRHILFVDSFSGESFAQEVE